MGDSQASLFAQRCYEPGMAKATFGSGTSVLLNVGDEFQPSGQGAGDGARLGPCTAGRPTRSKASSTTRRPRSPG